MLFKVCGMRAKSNIQALCTLAIDYIGFIFYPPSKRYVSTLSSDLLESIPKHIAKTGVFVNSELDFILEKVRNCDLQALQLHGSESPDLISSLRTELGSEVIILKALSIEDESDLEKTILYEDLIDYFLFDTKTAGYGGSGRQFDWRVLKAYKLAKPFFLSGGLDIDQIKIIQNLEPKPAGLDLNSRFELKPGLKDISKIGKFIAYFD